MNPLIRACLLLAFSSGNILAEPAALNLNGSRREVFKDVNGVELGLNIFEPVKRSEEPSPVIIFFFGGGWRQGTPAQFAEHCRYFASRGMLSIAAEYRVESRHQVKPVACVADAKSAIRWLRKNARRLSINPDRIVASGGSAGGHLAAATATITGVNEAGEDTSISAVPNALILFNPAVVVAPLNNLRLNGQYDSRWAGIEPEKISPAHHVTPGLPPTIIFHGRNDTTVPYATVEAFTAEMMRAGNRCELVGFIGQGHGFFNSYLQDHTLYLETLQRADDFLVSLNFLQPTAKEAISN